MTEKRKNFTNSFSTCLTFGQALAKVEKGKRRVVSNRKNLGCVRFVLSRPGYFSFFLIAIGFKSFAFACLFHYGLPLYVVAMVSINRRLLGNAFVVLLIIASLPINLSPFLHSFRCSLLLLHSAMNSHLVDSRSHSCVCIAFCVSRIRLNTNEVNRG